MYIEDDELRTLFRAECEEHLQHLDEGLLWLETNPADAATLELVFREAHNLKGAARMLGLSEIEMIAHRFEDLLGAAKRSETALSASLIDRLYKNLDAVRRLAHEAVSGESLAVDVSKTLQELSEETAPEPELENPAPEPVMEVEPVQAELAQAESAQAEPAQLGSFKIETIRVDPLKLDDLMTQTGELIVTRTRAVQRIAVLEGIMGFCEEWSRESAQMDFRGLTNGLPDEVRNLLSRMRDNERRRLEKLSERLGHLREDMRDNIGRLQFLAQQLDAKVRAVRLLPFSTLFNLFPRMVRDIAQSQGKEVNLVVLGAETTADKRILEDMKAPLMHMIRNSIDHGIESPEERKRLGKHRAGTLRVQASQDGARISLEVSDDGRGLNIESIKAAALKRKIVDENKLANMTRGEIESLIFAHGFSTTAVITDLSGRGVGMDAVRSNVELLKGVVSVASVPGAGCTFRVELPMSITTARVLLVEVEGVLIALPIEYIETTRLVDEDELSHVNGRQAILSEQQTLFVVRLATLLELPLRKAEPAKGESKRLTPCVILASGNQRLGLLVDQLVDEQEVMLKPHGSLLKRVRNVLGSTILATGDVCTILNTQDILKSAGAMRSVAPSTAEVEERPAQRTILLVDDSITTRTWEKRILEAASYEVVTAVDGLDAFQKLQSQSFDAVVTDVEMPNIDGITLTEKIRQDKRYHDLPVVLVTSLATDADKKRGIDAGADAYITKSSFEQKLLLETLKRLV